MAIVTIAVLALLFFYAQKVAVGATDRHVLHGKYFRVLASASLEHNQGREFSSWASSSARSLR